MRSLFLFLFVFLAACSSGSSDDPAGQLTPPPPPAGGGSGPGGGGAPGGGTAPAIALDDAYIDLGKPGAFPSDLVEGGSLLITVDDATIPANVVGYAGLQQTLSVSITANHLIDMDGTTPARAPTTYGTGLFGAFTGDLELAFDRWLLVTVGAGNSISDDGSAPLRLANLVVIDTQTAQVVQTVDLAWPKRHSGTFSQGGTFETIPQSLPVMCKFVASRSGTPTGQIFVALSNGAGSSAGLGEFYPGTVQIWKADFTATAPVSPETNNKASTDATLTHVSNHYNPVGLTRYTAGSGVSFVILTSAGASRLDTNFVAFPTTDAVLEFFDLDANLWRGGWTSNLGPILPAPHALALGEDLSGRSFGLLASQTYAAIYAVDLSGLESNPVDPARLGLLRTVDLQPGGSVTEGSAFLPGIAIAADGTSAVVSSFTTSGLTVVGLPADLSSGPFEIDPEPFASADLVAENAFGLGAVAVPGQDADVIAYVIVNGNFTSGRTGRIGVLR